MTKDQAITTLRGLLPVGTTVYTILRHCSRSGMQRVIELVIPMTRDDGHVGIRSISWLVAQATGWRLDTGKHNGLVARGCGMDMGFALVYELGRALYPSGFSCPPDRARNGDASGWDADGGYALEHEWL
jgi:hypothetical protein